MLVLRTPSFGVWYPQGVRVPPVKNHWYMLCKIGTLSATPEVRYTTPKGVTTPSLGSPGLYHTHVACGTVVIGNPKRHVRKA